MAGHGWMTFQEHIYSTTWIPCSCDGPGLWTEHHLPLSAVWSQVQCNMLVRTWSNCGHIGHWSNRRTLSGVMNLWLWPRTGSDITGVCGGGGRYWFCLSLWSSDVSLKLHLVGPETTHTLALNLATTSHPCFVDKEEQIFPPHSIPTLHSQFLNNKNMWPKGRRFWHHFPLVGWSLGKHQGKMTDYTFHTLVSAAGSTQITGQ